MNSDVPVFVIAEAGVNHNGDLERAHRLVEVAARARASAVKFQTFQSDRLAATSTPRAEYQVRQTGEGDQLSMLRGLELRPEWHAELARHCRGAGIEFMSTPFHREAVDLLAPWVTRFKIGSGDLTDLGLIDYAASFQKPMILSTGMADLDEVAAAVAVVARRGVPLTLMQCTSLYPTPMRHVNLRAMRTLAGRFGVPVGLSDHTEGLTAAVAAVALGATAIEKHFTTDRMLPGPDHRFSLDPAGLEALVRAVRDVEEAFGGDAKQPVEGEDEVRRVARKSLVTRGRIEAGMRVTAELVTVKRPGTGISPGELDKVLGKVARRTLEPDEVLSWEMLGDG